MRELAITAAKHAADRYGSENHAGTFSVAVRLGLRLRPRPHAKRQLVGRVIIFDGCQPYEVQQRDVALGIAEFLLPQARHAQVPILAAELLAVVAEPAPALAS